MVVCLGSKVVREIVYSSKEPGDEAIHGIVGVSRWATSAGREVCITFLRASFPSPLERCKVTSDIR